MKVWEGGVKRKRRKCVRGRVSDRNDRCVEKLRLWRQTARSRPRAAAPKIEFRRVALIGSTHCSVRMWCDVSADFPTPTPKNEIRLIDCRFELPPPPRRLHAEWTPRRVKRDHDRKPHPQQRPRPVYCVQNCLEKKYVWIYLALSFMWRRKTIMAYNDAPITLRADHEHLDCNAWWRSSFLTVFLLFNQFWPKL